VDNEEALEIAMEASGNIVGGIKDLVKVLGSLQRALDSMGKEGLQSGNKVARGMKNAEKAIRSARRAQAQGQKRDAQGRFVGGGGGGGGGDPGGFGGGGGGGMGDVGGLGFLASKIPTPAIAAAAGFVAVKKVVGAIVEDLKAIPRYVAAIVRGVRVLARAWFRINATILKIAVGINVGIIGALGMALKFAVDFETAMLRVGGVLSKNMAQMGFLEKTIRSIAKTSTFRPGELAGGAFSLASMGFSEADIAGMIAGVTKLSEALGADLAEAAELVATQIRIFNMRATDSTRIANVLAAANKYSAATFSKLAQALSYASQSAKAVGATFEQTVGFLMMMFNAGLDASRAGTAMRRMLMALSAQTPITGKILEMHLGKGLAHKVNPAVVGLTEALKNLERAGLSTSEQFVVFGARGVEGALAFARGGTVEFNKLTRAVTATQQAFTQAAIQTSGVGGQFKFLISSIEELAITLTEKMRKPLADALRSLAAFVNKLAESDQIKNFANALGAAARMGERLFTKWLSKINIAQLWPKVINTIATYLQIMGNIGATVFTVLSEGFKLLSTPEGAATIEAVWKTIVGFFQVSGRLVVGVMYGLSAVMEKVFTEDSRTTFELFVIIVKEALTLTMTLLHWTFRAMENKMEDLFGLFAIVSKTYRRLVATATSLKVGAEFLRELDVSELLDKSSGAIDMMTAKLEEGEGAGARFFRGFREGAAAFDATFNPAIAKALAFADRFTGTLAKSRGVVDRAIAKFKELGKAMVGDMEGFMDADALMEISSAVDKAQKALEKQYADPTMMLAEQLRATKDGIEGLIEASGALERRLKDQIDAFTKASKKWFGDQPVGGYVAQAATMQKAIQFINEIPQLAAAGFLGVTGGQLGAMTPEQQRQAAMQNQGIRDIAALQLMGAGLGEMEQLASAFFKERFVDKQTAAMQTQLSAIERTNELRRIEAGHIEKSIELRERAAEIDARREKLATNWQQYVGGRGQLQQAGLPVTQMPGGMSPGIMTLMRGLEMWSQELQVQANYHQSRVGTMAGHGQFGYGR